MSRPHFANRCLILSYDHFFFSRSEEARDAVMEHLKLPACKAFNKKYDTILEHNEGEAPKSKTSKSKVDQSSYLKLLDLATT
jgi:hypothetical protein